MTSPKITKLDSVATPVAVIDNTAPADQTAPIAPAPVPFNLTGFYSIMSEMAVSDFVIDNYNKAFARYTEAAVIKGELNPSIKMLLDFGFNRAFSVHTAAIPSMTDNVVKTAHIRLVEKYWSLSVMNKTAYDALFKVTTTASKGKTPAATVDYTPLITELQALHDSPDYTTEQAEDIAFLISSLTITSANTATDAKTFYTVLTTDKDFEAFQVYVKTALIAATEKAKAKAAAEAMATQTAEQIAKAKILARLKR